MVRLGSQGSRGSWELPQGGQVSSVRFASQTSQRPRFSIFMSLKPNMQMYAEVKPGLGYF